jgi:hypothetical protein
MGLAKLRSRYQKSLVGRGGMFARTLDQRHERIVRREAPLNRGRCKTSSPGCRSSLVEAERSLTRKTPGRAGSSAGKAGTA